MTQGQPQYYQQPYQPPRPRSNGLGIAGFIVSLVAIPTLGLLSPIALFLSFIALFRSPRGFAFAGFILGLFGTLFLAAWLSLIGLAGFKAFTLGKPFINTISAIQQAQEKVRDYSNTHMGALPGEADGNALIFGINDGWGHPMRYKPRGLATFEIRSAGPDGIFDNQDDVEQ